MEVADMASLFRGQFDEMVNGKGETRRCIGPCGGEMESQIGLNLSLRLCHCSLFSRSP